MSAPPAFSPQRPPSSHRSAPPWPGPPCVLVAVASESLTSPGAAVPCRPAGRRPSRRAPKARQGGGRPAQEGCDARTRPRPLDLGVRGHGCCPPRRCPPCARYPSLLVKALPCFGAFWWGSHVVVRPRPLDQRDDATLSSLPACHLFGCAPRPRSQLRVPEGNPRTAKPAPLARPVRRWPLAGARKTRRTSRRSAAHRCRTGRRV